LLTKAAVAFDAAYHTTTRVNPTTSQDGLMAVERGQADIGLSDIFVQDAPDPTVRSYVLTDYPVGVVVFTLMVSPDLKEIVHNITTDQLIDIYKWQSDELAQPGRAGRADYPDWPRDWVGHPGQFREICPPEHAEGY
jgi:ABC-type phosphate transport system substrate-binding protein